jgi:hypothetical protein
VDVAAPPGVLAGVQPAAGELRLRLIRIGLRDAERDVPDRIRVAWMPDRGGTHFGAFEMTNLLGAGGMGEAAT